MNKRILLFGLLLSLIVTGAMSWSGTEDSWWESNGYTEAEQLAGQTYETGRVWDGYSVKVDLDKSKYLESGYDLDWTDFDTKVGDIKGFIAAEPNLSAESKTKIQEIYDEAVNNKKKTERLWHSAMYSTADFPEITEEPFPVTRLLSRSYENVDVEWQANINNAQIMLMDTLNAFRVRVNLASAIADAEAKLESYGDASIKKTLQQAVTTAKETDTDWTLDANAITDAITQLNEALTENSV